MIKRTACLIARDTNPFYNIGLEKHLMDTLPEDTAILYLWQNDKTIVIGRNQNPWYECRVEEFLEGGGRIARRLSGGGAVYHDLGNLNFTFITQKPDMDVTKQLTVLKRAVGGFGVAADISGRNDLHSQGRKFSGNAFYTSGRAAFHHGTVLVKTDMDAMAEYLTVDESKLQKRGVMSVGSRVVNLSSIARDITVDGLTAALYQAFYDEYRMRPAMLDERMFDMATLLKLKGDFENLDFIYPKALPYGFSVAERFAWGGVTVKLHAEGGVIRHVKLFTDAMETEPFMRMERALTGAPFLISAITSRFETKILPEAEPHTRPIASDVCRLICGRMRLEDRNGGEK